MNRDTTKLSAVSVVAIGLLVLTLTACGGGGKSESGPATGSGSPAKEEGSGKFAGELAALYKGSFKPPTGPPLKKPVPGKDVWFISVGQSVETAQNLTKGLEAAAHTLEWNLHIFDGKFESTRFLTGIQQAIAAKAEGIIIFAFDCTAAKAGFEQAKAAGIPVVAIEGRDCNPGLFTYSVKFVDGQTYSEYLENGFAGDQAKWIVAKTEGDAKTILTVETDTYATRIAQPGIERVFDKCPGCEIVDVVDFVGTEFGPPLQEKIEQALNQYPEANSFIAAYDAVMTGGGGAAALRASGRLGEMQVMGGEGSAPGVELIYNKAGMDACSGIDYAWDGYAAVTALARIFLGQDPNSDESGIGSQVCDSEHNLPPKGESYKAPINYVSAYEKMWGLK
ncbi:MAG: substrate-binding domain-containing protein [Actinobacteria bacterium]|nr:substrate-binding domain-containing protein [Actinomycetota bacterium]